MYNYKSKKQHINIFGAIQKSIWGIKTAFDEEPHGRVNSFKLPLLAYILVQISNGLFL
jgi:hypothetical protein